MVTWKMIIATKNSIVLLVAVVFLLSASNCSSSKVPTVAEFRRLAETHRIQGMAESDVVRIFGSPDRVRKQATYYVHAYDFPTSSVFWDTECIIRFDGVSRRVTGWQTNSD